MSLENIDVENFTSYLIYLIPGLLAIKIYEHYTFSRNKLSFKELIFYSGILTVLVYTITSLFNQDILLSFVIAFIVLVALSFLASGIYRKFNQMENRSNTWQQFVTLGLRYYVTVKLTNEKYVIGILRASDYHAKENYDIMLENPYIFDKTDKEVSLGKFMYIPKKSILTMTRNVENENTDK